jgi:hypothetical protein
MIANGMELGTQCEGQKFQIFVNAAFTSESSKTKPISGILRKRYVELLEVNNQPNYKSHDHPE